MSAPLPVGLLAIPIAAVSLLSALALGQLLAWRRRRQQRRLGILALRGKLLAVEKGRPGEGAEMLALTIGRAGQKLRVLAPPSALPQGPPRLGKQLALEAVLDETLPAGEVLYRQNARSSGVAAIGIYPRWRLTRLAMPLGAAIGVATLLTMLQIPGKAHPIRDSAKGVHCLPGARLSTRPDYRGGFIHSCELPDGRRHGDVSRHAADGRLREVQRFAHGIPHGPFRSLYAFGGGRESGQYWRGERDETWVYRDDDGRLRGRVHFERGVRHGEFFLRNRRDAWLRGRYDRGKRVGPWRGQGRLCRPLDVRMPALLSVQGRPVAELCHFANGRLHGSHVLELAGQRLSGQFVQGRAEGRWQAWSTVTSRPLWAVTFQAGIRHGPYYRYHPNGSVQLHGQYAAGRRSGTWRAHAPLAPRRGKAQRGALVERCRYVAGRVAGRYDVWDTDGRLLLSGTLRGREPVGIWTVVGKSGRRRCTFRRGDRSHAYCPALPRALRGFRGSLLPLGDHGRT